MKISAKTKEILKNFCRINESIYIEGGNYIRTMSAKNNVFAMATVEDNFETPFAIHDLKKFISVISLMKDPDLIFDDRFVTIKEGNRSVKYFFCNPDHIVRPKWKNIPDLNCDVTFSMSADTIQSGLKYANTLRLPYLAFRGEGGKLTFEATDKDQGVSNDSYKYEIAEIDEDRNYCFYINQDRFNMLDLDYDLTIDRDRYG